MLTRHCKRCRDRRAELDEAQLDLAALKTLSDEADLLRARVAELEPLQVPPPLHILLKCVLPGCSVIRIPGSPSSAAMPELAPINLQDQLAAAQAAVAEAGVKLGEEQEARRDFLRQFQAKSKAALAERVELEHQVHSRWELHTFLGWVCPDHFAASEEHVSAHGTDTAQRAASTHMAGDELLLHVSPNHPVDDSHKTNYYGSEARSMLLLCCCFCCSVCCTDHATHVMVAGTTAGGGEWATGRSKGTAGGGRLPAKSAADSTGERRTEHPAPPCSVMMGGRCYAQDVHQHLHSLGATGRAGDHSCGNSQARGSAASCRGGARGRTW